jgi:hypothetical protein
VIPVSSALCIFIGNNQSRNIKQYFVKLTGISLETKKQPQTDRNVEIRYTLQRQKSETFEFFGNKESYLTVICPKKRNS